MVTIGNPELNSIIIWVTLSVSILICFLVLPDWIEEIQRRKIERDLKRIHDALLKLSKNDWDIFK